MSADKYPCIFSRQIETIVYLCHLCLRKLRDVDFFKICHIRLLDTIALASEIHVVSLCSIP